MKRSWLGQTLLVASFASLGGCAAMPTAGPTAGQIVDRAGKQLGAPLQVVDINGLAAIAAPVQAPASAPDWSLGEGQIPAGTIGTGDVLTVTIFEIGASLFSGSGRTSVDEAGGGAPTASGQVLPQLIVARDGGITVPYLGRIRAAGLLPEQLEAELQYRLRGRSQNPQVIVSIARGVASSVVVSGDVRQPGRQPLTLAGERLLDVIAQAGGPAGRSADTVVRLTRDGRTAERRLDGLVAGGAGDVLLAPGDRVELVRRARTFTVLGATRTVAEIPIESDRLTLAEALGRAGGPLDDRADAAGVFIFRFEPGVADGAPEIPTIYRLNMLDPQSFFSAQRFIMREKDVLYVANAQTNQLSKFAQMLNMLVSPAVTVQLLTQ